MIRYRRNINYLTADQLHAVREALAEISTLSAAAKNGFEHIASLRSFVWQTTTGPCKQRPISPLGVLLWTA